TLTLTFPPQVQSEAAMAAGDHLPLDTEESRPSAAQFSMPAGTAIELNAQSVLGVLGLPGVGLVSRGPLGEQTTVLEIPWHLLMTVTSQSGEAVMADHVTLPVTSPAGI